MKRYLLPLCLLALIGAVHARLWLGQGSVGNVAQMQRKLDEQRARNAVAQAANDRLASEVRDLREGLDMVEERARTELGMVKPNEIYVQVTTK